MDSISQFAMVNEFGANQVGSVENRIEYTSLDKDKKG